MDHYGVVSLLAGLFSLLVWLAPFAVILLLLKRFSRRP